MLDFSLYTVRNLIKLCELLEIDVPSGATKTVIVALLSDHTFDPRASAFLEPGLTVSLAERMTTTLLRRALWRYQISGYNQKKAWLVEHYVVLCQERFTNPETHLHVTQETIDQRTMLNERVTQRMSLHPEAMTKYNLIGSLTNINKHFNAQNNRIVYYAQLQNRADHGQDLVVTIPGIVMDRILNLVESGEASWEHIGVYGYFFDRKTFLAKDSNCARKGFRIVSANHAGAFAQTVSLVQEQ